MARKSRAIPEINAGSMADIAFLLLIFFLVTTTMDTDSGVTVKLPPFLEEDVPPPEYQPRNVLEVRVNSNNQLLVEQQYMRLDQLRDFAKKFLTNYGKDKNLSQSPQNAVVSFKSDRGTNYKTFIAIQNELKAAYREVREEYAIKKYGRKLEHLNEYQMKEVETAFPQKISEAEPETIGAE